MTPLTPLPAPTITEPSTTARHWAQLFTGLIIVAVAIVVGHSHWIMWLSAPAPTIATFLIALALGGVTMLPALAVIGWLWRRARKPLLILVGVTLYGALVATGLALPINEFQTDLLGSPRGGFTTAEELPVWLLSNAVLTPLTEEVVKGLGILLALWWLPRYRESPRDGILYGALIGVGFATLEYAVYVISHTQVGTPAPYLYFLVMRLPLFGLNGHVISSGLVGAGLGLAFVASPRRRTLLAGAFFLAGWLCHALGNSFGALGVVVLGLGLSGQLDELASVLTPFHYIAMWVGASMASVLELFLPGGLLFWQVSRSGQWEREAIVEHLADEVGTPVITADEHAAAARELPLSTRTIPGRPRAIARRIVAVQNRLAFRKASLRRSGISPEQDAAISDMRLQLAQLRAQ